MMHTSQLGGDGWGRLTQDSPAPDVITAVLGICRIGARIAYEGYCNTTTIRPQLRTAIAEAPTILANILVELDKFCLEVSPDRIS